MGKNKIEINLDYNYLKTLSVSELRELEQLCAEICVVSDMKIVLLEDSLLGEGA